MPHGVAFSRHPDSDGDGKIHLWKQTGEKNVQSYCGDFDAVNSIKSPTQVDKVAIKSWRKNEQVCDDCVDAVEENYTS